MYIFPLKIISRIDQCRLINDTNSLTPILPIISWDVRQTTYKSHFINSEDIGNMFQVIILYIYLYSFCVCKSILIEINLFSQHYHCIVFSYMLHYNNSQ